MNKKPSKLGEKIGKVKGGQTQHVFDPPLAISQTGKKRLEVISNGFRRVSILQKLTLTDSGKTDLYLFLKLRELQKSFRTQKKMTLDIPSISTRSSVAIIVLCGFGIQIYTVFRLWETNLHGMYFSQN